MTKNACTTKDQFIQQARSQLNTQCAQHIQPAGTVLEHLPSFTADILALRALTLRQQIRRVFRKLFGKHTWMDKSLL